MRKIDNHISVPLENLMFLDQAMDRAWKKALRAIRKSDEVLGNLDNSETRCWLICFSEGGEVEFNQGTMNEFAAKYFGIDEDTARKSYLPDWINLAGGSMFDKRVLKKKGSPILLKPSDRLHSLIAYYKKYLVEYLQYNVDDKDNDMLNIPLLLKNRSKQDAKDR